MQYVSPTRLKSGTDYIREIKELEELLLTDERDFVVGSSFGKDSVVTLDIFCKAMIRIPLEKRKKSYILFSDTTIEMDPYIETVHKQIDFVRIKLKQLGLDKYIEIVVVKPLLKDRFFALSIGRGYLPANRSFRWCTDRWKIAPARKFMASIVKNNKKNGFVSLTGVRHEESSDRSNRIKSNTIGDATSHFKKHSVKTSLLYTPIEFFSTSDVWDYIHNHAMVFSAALVEEQYNLDDNIGECTPLTEGGINGKQPGCSSSRNGCVICPLFIGTDKTLSNLTKTYDYLTVIEDWRNWFVKYAINNWSVRDLYNHKSWKLNLYNFDNHRKGMHIPGGFSMDFRKTMLKKLKGVDDEVFIAKGYHFVPDDQLILIQESWINEGDFDFTAFSIMDRKHLEISDKSKNTLSFAKMVYRNKNLWNFRIMEEYEKYYAARTAILNYEGFSGGDIENIICPKKDKGEFFPDSTGLDIYVRSEHTRDKVNFHTYESLRESGYYPKPERNLFGYDSEFAEYEEVIDEIDAHDKEKSYDFLNSNIPIEDKYKFLEEW